MRLVLLLFLLSVHSIAADSAISQRPVVVAYVPNWIELGKFSEAIPYEKLTHVNVAFENPVNDAGDLSFHEEDALLIKKAHAHGVKVLVSIGGGAASEDKVLLKRYATLLRPKQRAG